MPRSTRQWSHRKIGNAQGCINNAQEHLAEIRKVYQEQHEDIALSMALVETLLEETITMLDKIKDSY